MRDSQLLYPMIALLVLTGTVRVMLSRSRVKYMLNNALIAAIVTLALGAARAAQPGATLIENVHGYTLAGDRLERFSGLLFESGRVVRTGNAAALHKAYPHAQVIDAGGKTLLPGLIDAHGHVMDLGFENVRIQLFDTETLAQAQERIRAYAHANPQRAWYLGDGWNQVKWKLGRFPRASELDSRHRRSARGARSRRRARAVAQYAGLARGGHHPRHAGSRSGAGSSGMLTATRRGAGR